MLAESKPRSAAPTFSTHPQSHLRNVGHDDAADGDDVDDNDNYDTDNDAATAVVCDQNRHKIKTMTFSYGRH